MMDMNINYLIGHKNKKLCGVINESKNKLSLTYSKMSLQFLCNAHII